VLIDSLDRDEAPKFRRTWSESSDPPTRELTPLPTRVMLDNSTSDTSTVVDIFTFDRPGLLYAIARTLFELDLSIAAARIGTHLDQVVDVFYVTDQQTGEKIEDRQRQEEIRRRLLAAVEAKQLES